MTLRIAALDPGASPTLAFLSPDNTLSFAEGDALAGKTATGKTRPIPALCRAALFGFTGGNLPDLLVIEDVRGMPGDSRGSGEVLTYCVGLVEGIATGLEVRVRRVTPVVWKRWAGLLKADKDASRRAACDLFIAQAGLFSRKKDEHRAEAALMAMWGAAQLSAERRAA
jgi:crossover junction endodeoxyribonuclease RuvC